MASTKTKLEQLSTNLDESIGLREVKPHQGPSPVASPKDIGRRPLRNVGRIAVDQVIPDPSQPRVLFDEGAIERLGNSIREQGQLSPIRVRWSAEHQKWIIVCGERRWRAIKSAGIASIDCCFEPKSLSDKQVLEHQMIENLLREDLSPTEQARGFSAIMERKGWNGKQVSEALHIPASTVSRALALLDLPPDIQRQVDTGAIAARSAYEISRLGNENHQRQIASKVASGMSLRQTQDEIKKTQVKSVARTPRPQAPANSKRLKFFAENGWTLTACPPTDGQKRTYDDLKMAIDEINEEIRLRIHANIRIA